MVRTVPNDHGWVTGSQHSVGIRRCNPENLLKTLMKFGAFSLFSDCKIIIKICSFGVNKFVL